MEGLKMKKYGRERIQKILKEIDLPKTTKFKGYVVHMPESDEFLRTTKEIQSGVVANTWINDPEEALLFKKREKAIKVINGYDKNGVSLCLLLDSGPQLIPIPEEAVLKLLGLV